MKKSAKVGLAGLLGIALVGCATVPYTRTEYVSYTRPAVIQKEEKSIVKNIVSEDITDVRQEGYNLNVIVDETSKNLVCKNITKSVETVSRIDTITDGSDSVLGVPCVGWTPKQVISGPEKVSTNLITEKKEDEEEVYTHQPKGGIPVKFSSKYFKFNNTPDDVVINTDDEGKTSATLTSYPLFWRVEEGEVMDIINKSLSNQILDKSLKEKFLGSLQLKESSYDIKVETAKRGGVIEYEGNSLFQEIKNDEREFSVKGWKADFAEAYKEVENIIKNDLEKRCISSFNINIKDLESHFPVNGAVISFKTKKFPQLEGLIKEEEGVRGKYFVRGSELYEGTKVDPSYLLMNLDQKQISVPLGGYNLKSNIGAVYEIEVIHPDYKFLQGELAFSRENQNKIIELLSLGSKIRKQDVKDNEGGIKEAR